MKSTELTLEPVNASAAACSPEFLDAEGVEKCFGIRRAMLWRLLAENRIRGVSIRQQGRLRGKRLFDCASIRAFLLSNVERPLWSVPRRARKAALQDQAVREEASA
jgi:hypothetical protein